MKIKWRIIEFGGTFPSSLAFEKWNERVDTESSFLSHRANLLGTSSQCCSNMYKSTLPPDHSHFMAATNSRVASLGFTNQCQCKKCSKIIYFSICVTDILQRIKLFSSYLDAVRQDFLHVTFVNPNLPNPFISLCLCMIFEDSGGKSAVTVS